MWWRWLEVYKYLLSVELESDCNEQLGLTINTSAGGDDSIADDDLYVAILCNYMFDTVEFEMHDECNRELVYDYDIVIIWKVCLTFHCSHGAILKTSLAILVKQQYF